ncbi:hypothetical protein STIAU_7266, partial [Stigmatella aurantiaca DW4/3-1]
EEAARVNSRASITTSGNPAAPGASNGRP